MGKGWTGLKWSVQVKLSTAQALGLHAVRRGETLIAKGVAKALARRGLVVLLEETSRGYRVRLATHAERAEAVETSTATATAATVLDPQTFQETPMHVKHIRATNLKAPSLEHDLGPRTLIVGRNGTQKTATINAVELALSGSCSYVAGRDFASRGVDLLALMPARQGVLEAVATLDNGEVCSYSMATRSAGATTEPIESRPASIGADPFPVRTILEALASADKAYTFFIQHAPITHDDVLTHIPGALHAMYRSAAGLDHDEKFRPGPIAALLGARTVVTARVKDATANARAAEKQIQVAGLAAPPTAIQLADARNRLRDTESALTAARGYGEGLRLQDQALDIDGQIAAMPVAGIAVNMERAAALRLLVARSIEVNASVCGLCMHTVADGVQHWQDRFATIEALIAQADPNPQRASLIAQANDLRNRATTIFQHGNTNVPDLSAAVGAYDVVLATVSSMERALGAHEVVQRARDAGLEAERQKATWGQLGDAIVDAIRTLLEQTAAGFCERVQKFLPATDAQGRGMQFGLKLTEGDREVFQFGLVRDGVLHTAVSEVERIAILLAMACAMTPSASGLRVLTVPDRAWDPRTLSDVMAALSHAPCQVILTSTVKPAGRVLAGWTLIDLDAGVSAGAAEGAAVANGSGESDGVATVKKPRKPRKPKAGIAVAVAAANGHAVANASAPEPTAASSELRAARERLAGRPDNEIAGSWTVNALRALLHYHAEKADKGEARADVVPALLAAAYGQDAGQPNAEYVML